MAGSEKRVLRVVQVLGSLLLIGIAAAMLLFGPGIDLTINRVRMNPEDPRSPERLLECAKAQLLIHKSDEAKATLKLWIELFVEEREREWEPLLSNEGEISTQGYGLGEGLEQSGFTPWLFTGGKAHPMQVASEPMTGEALLLYAGLLESEKEYKKAAHVRFCLASLWPKTSPTYEAALDALKGTGPGRHF